MSHVSKVMINIGFRKNNNELFIYWPKSPYQPEFSRIDQNG